MISEEEFNKIRFATRQLCSDQWDKSTSESPDIAGAEQLHINKAKWEGLLDFIELDLYDKLTKNKPNELDFDIYHQRGKEEYNQAMANYNKSRKEMFMYFDMFSHGRRIGKFQHPENFLKLFMKFRDFQSKAIDYFLE